MGITLLARVQGTRPPWRGLGDTLLPCRAGLWSIRGESPVLQVHVPPLPSPPQADPFGLGLCQQNRCLGAEPREAETGQVQEQGRVGQGLGLANRTHQHDFAPSELLSV